MVSDEHELLGIGGHNTIITTIFKNDIVASQSPGFHGGLLFYYYMTLLCPTVVVAIMALFVPSCSLFFFSLSLPLCSSERGVRVRHKLHICY